VFSKKTAATPAHVLATCQRRLRAYDAVARDSKEDR
jgi:phage-related protein